MGLLVPPNLTVYDSFLRDCSYMEANQGIYIQSETGMQRLLLGIRGTPSSSSSVEDFLKKKFIFQKSLFFPVAHLNSIESVYLTITTHICASENPLSLCWWQAKRVGLLPFILSVFVAEVCIIRKVPLKSSFHHVTGFTTCCAGVISRSRRAASFRPQEYTPLTMVFSLFLFWPHL